MENSAEKDKLRPKRPVPPRPKPNQLIKAGITPSSVETKPEACISTTGGKTDDELLQEFLNADLSELELGSANLQAVPTLNSAPALPPPPTELLSPAPMSLITTNLPVAPPRAKTVTENLIGSFSTESQDQTGNCELEAESSKRDDDEVIKVNEGVNDFVTLRKEALQGNNILDSNTKDMKDLSAAERLFQKFEAMENQIRILNEENAKLKSEQEIFGEKYVNVAKRFHYVEDKIRRKDAERLTAEKTILETLEKMNDSQEKIQKMVKSNEDAMKEFKELKISEQETETKFKETLKRFFKVEAQLLKTKRSQLLDIFKHIDMEEDYLMLGGDEDTDMAEIAAAYKKQANQQNQELEAFQICQICIEKFDNTTRPRVCLTTCGHTTCAECAESIIKNSPFAVTGTGACPTCQMHYSRHQVVKVIL